LQRKGEWPENVITNPSPESEFEAKTVREVLAVAVQKRDELDQMMEKHEFWKAVRITTWIVRFIRNCRLKLQSRKNGPMATKETDEGVDLWIKRVQARYEETSEFQEDKLRLNLQKNEQGIYKCYGRIQGHYPTFLPDKSALTEKIVMHAHTQTLHGRVGLTMTSVREHYWIPRLRSLTK
jgi:hypothetical protein